MKRRGSFAECRRDKASSSEPRSHNQGGTDEGAQGFCFLDKEETLAWTMRVNVAKQCKEDSGFSHCLCELAVCCTAKEMNMIIVCNYRGWKKASIPLSMHTWGDTFTFLNAWHALLSAWYIPVHLSKTTQSHFFYDTFLHSMLTRQI